VDVFPAQMSVGRRDKKGLAETALRDQLRDTDRLVEEKLIARADGNAACEDAGVAKPGEKRAALILIAAWDLIPKRNPIFVVEAKRWSPLLCRLVLADRQIEAFTADALRKLPHFLAMCPKRCHPAEKKG
jgi:hypothetical protein